MAGARGRKVERGALVLALGLAACTLHGGVGAPEDTPSAAPVAPPPTAAILPSPGGDLAPALAHVERSTGTQTGATLAEVASCGHCHGDIEAQWRSSAHAFASFDDPIYRVAVERLRKDRGDAASRFCAACHDVALLADGAMDRPIEPKDPRAHAGVACRMCHGITATRPDGNGSYTLDAGDFPVPRPGDAASVGRHKARAAASPLRTASLCATCHKAFLHEGTGNDHFMVGQDDATPWARSAFAGSLAERVDATVAAQECRDCHMPREAASDPAAKDGKVASHRFTGAHTWLAQMRGDGEQRRRAQAMLASAVTLDVAALVTGNGTRTLPAEEGALTAGDRAIVEIVTRNVGAGHSFPGGVGDAQDTWLEVVIDDARGERVAEAGTRYEAAGDDATAHRFGSAVAGKDGRPLLGRETHLFEAVAYDHTIAPRDADVARFAFGVPAGAKGPLRVVARLRHRARRLALQRAACDDARTARGRAFADAALARKKERGLDPCPPQPVTDVARAEALLGVGAPASSAAPPSARAFQRAFDHGLAMLHEVGERQGESRPSFERALSQATSERERAMALGGLARLAVEQGQVEGALALVEKASALVPGHPALARLRGEALAIAWRWGDAAAALSEAATGAPKDDAVWARLAVMWGGAGRERDALDAAQRGLLLSPRDADMLRVQALSLRALGGAADVTARAEAAFLAARSPDVAPALRSRCARDVPGCALERLPVHVHEMRP